MTLTSFKTYWPELYQQFSRTQWAHMKHEPFYKRLYYFLEGISCMITITPVYNKNDVAFFWPSFRTPDGFERNFENKVFACPDACVKYCVNRLLSYIRVKPACLFASE